MTRKPDSRSWFDDQSLLEDELRIAFSATKVSPEIPGYDSLRELARGGQGVVYSGIQVSTRRIVAVKVLREGPADGVRGHERFRREVDLAASLKHPNVVAIHDSGMTGDGRPFLVMELVDGPTIDHCETVVEAMRCGYEKPALEAALRTFLAACDGVAHAHVRGVVHRDLKPGNIRVDAEGRPRVLDFGLAKDLRPSTDRLELTLSGTGANFLGSLPWASPEQALGRIDEVDVRSDVYALGVVLHQLLTGEFPYDIESDLRTALDSIVQATPTSVRRRFKAIPTDVETIVLKCLQKDPARRYQSAGELARDIRRYLDGLPIDARRDSTWYLLRTTARRHRGAVVLVTLALLCLIGGLIVSLVFWNEARDERDAANEAKKVANEQKEAAIDAARRAERAMNYFADTMGSVDPNIDGPDVKMLDVVKRAVAQLPERFADDADTKCFFYTRFVELLRNLSDLSGAEAVAREAVEVATKQWGDDNSNSIFTKANLALIIHMQGRSQEAIPILETEARRLRDKPSLADEASRHVFSNLGIALIAVGRVDEAEGVFREMQSIKLPESRHFESECVSLETLAAIQGYRGNLREAVELLRKSLSLRIASLGPEHSLTLRCRGNLAFYLADLEQLDEAEKIEREIVEVYRRRMGPTSLDYLTGLNNHANYLERLDRLDEAELELRECYEGRVARLGEDHAHTLVTLGNLATVATKRKDFAAAERDQTKIVEIRTRLNGPIHVDTLIARNNLAHVMDERGAHAEAAAQMRDVVTDAEKTLGADHVSTAQFRSNLGAFLHLSGDDASAEGQLRHALRVIEEKVGVQSNSARGTRRRLCEVLRATGREDEAKAIELKAIESGN